MDWSDLQIIHQDCHEQFICLPEYSGDLASTIELCGISTLKTEYRIRRDRNPSHLLLFTISGEGKLTLPGGQYRVPEQSVMVLPADSQYLFEIEAEQWQTVWFLLQDSSQWQNMAGIKPGVYDCRESRLIRSTLALIVEQHNLFAETDAVKERQLIALLVDYINRSLSMQTSLNRQQARIIKLFEQVKSQLHSPWSTSSLAAKLHMSEPHFYRLCQQTLNRSPMTYITELRMDYASELLKHTNLSVEQIAQRLAYQSVSSFSIRFKKQFGTSPARWRNDHRGVA